MLELPCNAPWDWPQALWLGCASIRKSVHKNEIVYTIQKSASWRQRNICAENNTHHPWLITICQEMVTNIQYFTTVVPASHLIHRGWPCRSLTIYTVYAGRGIRNHYKQLVLLFNAGTIICVPVYRSVSAVAPKQNRKFCIFLTHIKQKFTNMMFHFFW
jgi:hypothetical protein